MSENANNVQQVKRKSTPIDFGKIFKDLLKHKRLYFIALPIAFVVAAFYALSLPNFYSCTVKLSPELSSTRSNASLLSLASSFGVNLGSSGGGLGTEALFPTVYPDLMNSVDFKTSLFPIPVTIEGNKKKGTPSRTMSYYDYLCNEQKAPWWTKAQMSLFKLVLGEKKKKDEDDDKKEIDPFRLTRKQTAVVKGLNRRVTCKVDKKTMVITINVIDQNPVICATMADSVKTHLQTFITKYRTSKARVDLAYNLKIREEAKARYDEARRRYAAFADANQDIMLESVRMRLTELENEMQLQYNAYTQVSAQVLSAEARVQQETPAFTTLQSATVPVRKSGPSRSKMCLAFCFFVFVCITVYVLNKEDDLKPLLGL
ncbi:MAG: chain-length determining protein [Bacteroidaceae bacterium]|nr:chain-length determining protein [Bacteroidaceae bacterium]